MNKIKVGIVIAKEEKDLSELKKFVVDPSVDILLFPEGYLNSEQLPEVQRIMKKYKKYLITSMADRRQKGKLYQTGIIVDPSGKIIGEHKKTSITPYEIGLGTLQGNDPVQVIETDFGKIGMVVCAEMYTPEVSRIYALQRATIIFNPIGTGMWNEQQYERWNATAITRAAENGTFVLGCSHYTDTIPLAFAYEPDGHCIVRVRDVNKLVTVTLDLDKYKQWDFSQRQPELYGELIKIDEKT